jgi:hypothetical protein
MRPWTDQELEVLRQCYPSLKTADLDNTGLVSALLAGDIEKGRVFMRAGKYHWNPQHDEQLQAQLKAAANLLKRHGYKVSKT